MKIVLKQLQLVILSEIMALHLCFSWRTRDFGSCWGLVVKLSWFWKETMLQRARPCRRCWLALMSAYGKVKSAGCLASAPSVLLLLCTVCRHTPLHLSLYRLFLPRPLVHSQHFSSKLHPRVASSVHIHFLSFVGTFNVFPNFATLHEPMVPARFLSVNE